MTMTDIRSPLQMFRSWWDMATGHDHDDETPSLAPGDMLVHDPAAERARDLDDPFVDPATQSRIGDAIAHAARRDKN